MLTHTHTTITDTPGVCATTLNDRTRERNERRDQRQALTRGFATTTPLYRRMSISRGKRILL